MFYSYAPWILAIFGASFGITGYYLDIIYQIPYEWLPWVAVSITLTIAGFITGRLIQRLSISSYTDHLTGLWNRRYFSVRLDEEEARATRKQTPLCVAMIDVDDFKRVNDTYGHAVGDMLLSDLATILKKNTRATDIVARWGGDEFAIIFSETSLEAAYEVMERMRQKVEAKFASAYGLTISAGIISLEPDRAIKDLLIKADQALYQAKVRKNWINTAFEIKG